MSVHLVLIETAGNQGFIFSTNKLRENIGASEIIYRIGTQFVLEAAKGRSAFPGDWWPSADPAKGKLPPAKPHPRELAKWLCNESNNPRIETQGEDGVEVVVATSGKALLLVHDRTLGEDIVAKVTKRALKETPGAVVRGYVSETGVLAPFGEDDSAAELHKLVGDVHEGIETLRARLPAPEGRLAMVPMVAPCQTSGLPAEDIFDYGHKGTGEDQLDDRPPADDCAVPVRAKRNMRRPGWRRMQMLAGDDNGKGNERKLAQDISRLEDMDLEWHAVVHADGNGVGSIFLGFLDRVKTALGHDNPSAREYVDAYRNFSISLELCTLAAFATALDTLPRRKIRLKKSGKTDWFLPVVPLVLGGDDLTVVCDGRAAVDFAATYLKEFERQSSDKTRVDFAGFNVHKIAGGCLAACAGVAVVKPHFPFHRAYQLAEDLLRSAKDVKRKVTRRDAEGKDRPVPCSALDFHVHFDSSGADLASIRESLDVEGAVLTAKPYVMTTLDHLENGSRASTEARGWVGLRLWQAGDKRNRSGLLDAAKALAHRGDRDEGSNLPRGQQHYLREGLFLGKDIANGRLQQIAHRYNGFRWPKLRPDADRVMAMKDMFFTDELFNKDRERQGKPLADLTWFLDALELAELRGRPEEQTESNVTQNQPGATPTAGEGADDGQ